MEGTNLEASTSMAVLHVETRNGVPEARGKKN